MKALLTTFATLMICSLAAPTSAHHNFLSHYDFDAAPWTIEGTVKSFWFVSPHIRFYVDVPGEDGESVEWVIEGRNRNILQREGWTGNEVKQGYHIIISGRPSRNGGTKLPNHLALSGLIMVNGKAFSAQPFDRKLTDFELSGEGNEGTSESHLDNRPGGMGMGMGN